MSEPLPENLLSARLTVEPVCMRNWPPKSVNVAVTLPLIASIIGARQPGR